jgi:hypothetical protein
MTDEQMRDLVKECGLDWHRGYMPLFPRRPDKPIRGVDRGR